MEKVIIVGGVAGGASTAARLRRLNESAEIILLEKGEAISYANCGLPYYIGNVISERDNLFLQTPVSMKQRFQIDVRVRNEVIRIDRDRKELEIKDLQQGKTYRESYDRLVLATGSIPIIPNIPGSHLPRVFTLRNIPDTDRMKQFLLENKVASAVVVGGGFIGLEMAENLVHLKKKVTLVEKTEQVLNNLDYEMAALVHQELRNNGVQLLLGNGLSAISEANKGLEIILEDGRKIPTDMIILAVGVRPEVKLAVEAGLELGDTGAIRVSRQFQTSDPNIFAIGDAVEIPELIGGQTTWVPLAGPANHQGRILADFLAGKAIDYQGALGTAIVKTFDLTAGSTGLPEKTLRKRGIEYRTSITHSNSHASYYPGAAPVSIKVLFAPDGRLLGAQVVGYDGADKRLDVLATAIRFGKSVFDLTELELAYAPPFSAAKDPVNMAGYTASNIINGDVEVVTWDQVAEGNLKNMFLLDVRQPEETELGLIPGSVLIPLPQLRDRLHELPKNREILVYCQVGLRAYIAARILTQNGFKAKNLSGGYKTFKLASMERELISNAAKKVKAAVMADNGESFEEVPVMETVKLNACGLQCPGPILQVFNKIQQLNDGEVLEVTASDPGFANDIGSWCQRTGNTLLRLERETGKIIAWIRKGKTEQKQSSVSAGSTGNQDKTIVVFSGDLDKAIASFVIATGAASMGRKVTMFFTFWGLNILRKPRRVKVAKGLLDRAFGMMMPRGSTKLGLSRMNMGGFGPKLIRKVMGWKNIASLESMISQARMMGIRLVACQMSIDVMGIKKEELLDGVEIGGVASYLAAAEESNVNLFI